MKRKIFVERMHMRLRTHLVSEKQDMQLMWEGTFVLSCAILLLMFLHHAPCAAQAIFSDSSALKDPRYLDERIKNITDKDVFTSLHFERPEMHRIRDAVQDVNFQSAYNAWAAYWADKKQPSYITQNYQLLIDTDLLMSYDEMLAYASKFPEERDTVITRAEAILRNEIRTWGARVEKFGPVVDFNREMGRSGKYGFHYWMWSRPLNTAYVLTRDQKYLEKFDELFNQWYEQRNSITRGFPELDVVYYELGLGVRNRMFIEHYVLPYEKRSVKTHERMLKTMLGAARWLYELQKWEGYRAGNWQIHGAYMLAQIAMVFPEFKASRDWLEIALQRLEEHMMQDFFEDGGHSERAPRNYTLATYLSYRNLYYLLTMYKVREDLAQRIRQSMGKTIDWWIAMLAPTGEIPAINDSHRGLFLIGILRDGAEFFGKPEVYGVMKNLFGINEHQNTLLPSFTSRHMPASGFTVMRTDWSPDALYMNINYGPFSGFHTHNDMLDFEIYAFGKALAVDAGIGLTYDDTLYIPWYQSSKAHNMVVVNDRNIERKEIKGEHIEWSSTPSLDYFSGDHRGYAFMGVQHRRQIVFVKPHYWFVLDDVTCQRDGDTLSWYFHSPTRLISFPRGFRSISAPGIVVLPASADLTLAVGTGLSASTVDKTPGATQEVNWVRFDQRTSHGSVRQFPVLLLPFESEPQLVEAVQNSSQQFILKTDLFTDKLYFPNGSYDDGEIATDARFLQVRSTSGVPETYSIVHGTYLRYQGKEMWRSPTPASSDGRFPP